MKLNAVYQKVPEGYIGFVKELPCANTQGKTLEEARANLQEAIEMTLEANQNLAEESIAEIPDAIREPIFVRQPPETRWVQNLRHPSYQLRQPIPILVEKEDDVVTANYDDVGLCGTGENVKAAILDLCATIVAHYEELQANGVKSHDYTFLK